MAVNDNVTLEGVKLYFRNFSGKELKYNAAGRRNFCVFLEEDLAQQLKADGWNVKWLNPKNEGDLPQACLQVAVSFGNVPPKIALVKYRMVDGVQKPILTMLTDETISILDWAEIEKADVIIRPYNWDVNGNKGVKAYVKSMYVVIMEDEFESKYYDEPDPTTEE